MYPLLRRHGQMKPRTVMSSIMRWRSGLIASSVIGLLPVFEMKVS